MGLTIIRRASPDDGDITILMTITSTYTLGDSETLPVSTPTSSKSTSIVYKTTTLVTSVTSKRSSTTTSSTFDHSSSLESSMFETETEDSSPISSNISNSSPSPSASNIALTLDRDVDGSGKSTKLGLAVGLPVSIFAVFLFVALGFFLLKRKSDKKMLEYENEYYSYPPDRSPITKLAKSRIQPTVSMVPENATKETQEAFDASSIYSTLHSTPRILPGPQRRAYRNSIGNFFKDRLSKVIKVQDIRMGEENSIDSRLNSHPNLSRSSMFMSPVFLKRFHLGKGANKETKNDANTIQPQLVPMPYSEQTIQLGPVGSRRDGRINRAKSKLTLPPIISNGENEQEEKPQEHQNVHVVVQDYRRKLNDELTIAVGQDVAVIGKIVDGWCKVRLLGRDIDFLQGKNSRIEGVVPAYCLQKL
ncbi:hypothetical protein PICST_29077 [Scheffersomyces stipitis CBS 6054]|uniref:SH3 domain-containing protein n=1 Tax=Scheffersomyces stipitis (strain ATCC 58785 / CBS 6054 / NBRC 10063 / NRRL Y-11545) TaxID=322104 RepID=A3GHR4_PICST|nr:hypothetical protein PICST_29077 [Scheffersomyces stipitis CBS 6054]EAZ62865.2 hypothetical protein PICST_29077 [Scheffersomyces stipitis CBS 6054]